MELAPSNAAQEAALIAALFEAGHEERTADQIAGQTNLPQSEVRALLKNLTEAGSIIQVLPLDEGDAPGYLLPASWERVKQTACRTVAAYHRKNPYKKWMPLGGLRESLQKAATLWGHDLRRVALRLHEAGDLIWEPKRGVRLLSHEVVLPPGWEKPAREIMSVFQSAGLNPPPPSAFERDYPRDVNTRAILQILTERGDLLQIAHGVLLAAPVAHETKETARRLAVSPSGLSVASLRDATGSSRKIIVPFLEWMDAQKITERQGDTRILL